MAPEVIKLSLFSKSSDVWRYYTCLTPPDLYRSTVTEYIYLLLFISTLHPEYVTPLASFVLRENTRIFLSLRLSSQFRRVTVGAADRRGSLPGDRRAGGGLRCCNEQADTPHPLDVPWTFRSAAGR